MERSEKGWVRGAIVVGLAGAMMAVALLSPALAVRLATTGYVKAKVNQAKNQLSGQIGSLQGTVNNLNQLTYVQGAALVVAPSTLGQTEAVCPAGSYVTGGGGVAQIGAGLQVDSYPSHGVGFPPPSGLAPAGHTAWAFEYATGSSGDTIRAYAICSRVATRSGYTAGTLPFKTASRQAA